MKTFSRFLIIGLSTTVALFSCKKDDAIGNDLYGNPNLIDAEIVDTFSVVTYNGIEDSVLTSNKSNHALGGYISDETGKAASILYATVFPEDITYSFPTANFAIDSVMLRLELNGTYGQTSSNQTFNVYRLTSSVVSDSTYYGFDSLPSLATKIGTFTLNTNDSGWVSFPLDSLVGAELISANSDTLGSEYKFRHYFEGIKIVPDLSGLSNNEGAVYSITATGVEIEVGYHLTTGDDSGLDLNPTFKPNTDNFLFSQFKHDFAGSYLESGINDTTLGQDMVYVQSMNSGFGNVKFPGVQNWYNTAGNYLINKFEFKIYAANIAPFDYPEELIFVYTNSEGTRYFWTGTIDESDYSYTFLVDATEIDAQLKVGTFNNMDFKLAVPFPGQTGELASLIGSNGLTPPVLKIYYTEYN